jgi:glycosyltransferase involved in cell wall biosynthesis
MKWSAFATAQLFCLPSHQENFGVAVAESLSVGLPVCISSAVNISDMVHQAGAGLVHPDTFAGTSDALVRWNRMDKAARSQMSHNAFQLFSSEFHWEQASEHLADLLLSVYNSKWPTAVP